MRIRITEDTLDKRSKFVFSRRQDFTHFYCGLKALEVEAAECGLN